MRARGLLLAVVSLILLIASVATGQGKPDHNPPPRPNFQGPTDAPRPRGPGQFPPDMVLPNRPRADEIQQRARALKDKPLAEHGEHAEHGGHAEHDEKAPPPPINWWHGLLGEKEGVHPSLLWREPGEPPPYLASLLNFGVLVFIVVRFGKKPLREALVKRKENIVRELEEARRLHESAQKRLAEYESRLGKIHVDLERIQKEFREQGEQDKQRIVAEAKERRERMKRDAEVLLSQEVKQMRQELVVEVVREATHLATELLSKEMTLGDHDRFAEMFLAELRSGGKLRGFGAVAASAAAKGSGQS